MVEGISELGEGVLLGERYRLAHRIELFADAVERVAGVEYEYWAAQDVASGEPVWIQFAAADGVYAGGGALAGAVAALRRINHPAVPAVLAFGEYEFELEDAVAAVGYCAIPAAAGETLAAAVLREELDQAEILAALAQVSEVLELLAEFELVHGHLSAHSVLLSESEDSAGYRVVLADLPASLALETALESELTGAADIYALAWLTVLALVGPAALEAEFGAGFAVTTEIEALAEQVIRRRRVWAEENLVALGFSAELAEVLVLALGEAAFRPRAAVLTAALRAEWMLYAEGVGGAAEIAGAAAVAAAEAGAGAAAGVGIAAEAAALAEVEVAEELAEVEVAEEAAVEAEAEVQDEAVIAAAAAGAAVGVVAGVAVAEELAAGQAAAAGVGGAAGVVGSSGAADGSGGVVGAGSGGAAGVGVAAGVAETAMLAEAVGVLGGSGGPSSGGGVGSAGGVVGSAGVGSAAGLAAGEVTEVIPRTPGVARAGSGGGSSSSGAARGAGSAAAFSSGPVGGGPAGGGSAGGSNNSGTNSGSTNHGGGTRRPRRPHPGVLLGAGVGVVIVIVLIIVFATGGSKGGSASASSGLSTPGATASATASSAASASASASAGGTGTPAAGSVSAGASASGTAATATAGSGGVATVSATSGGAGSTASAVSSAGGVTFPSALATVPASASQAVQQIQTAVTQAQGELTASEQSQLTQITSTLNQEISSGQSISTGVAQLWSVLHSGELPSSFSSYVGLLASYLSASQGS